jgi:VCBS repeat-containing protein
MSTYPSYTLVSSPDVLINQGFGPQPWGDEVTISAFDWFGNPGAVSYDDQFIDVGFGVGGGRYDVGGGRYKQLDFTTSADGFSNLSERLEIDFGGSVSNIVITFGQMSTDEQNRDETGIWIGYNSQGQKVAEGLLDPDDSILGPSVKVPGSGKSFPLALSSPEPLSKIVIEATGFDHGTSSPIFGRAYEENSDFNISDLSYERVSYFNNTNTPPIAVDDVFTTDEDTVLTGNVLSNDTDAEGESLSASELVSPSNGSFSLTADGSFSYTPNPNFNGSDSFTYQISDPQGGLDQATVTLTVNPVNDAPTAVADSFNTQQDTPVAFDVLANDSDIDGDSLVFNSFTAAGNGSLVNQGNGNLTYTPNVGFIGTDSFSYTIADSEGLTATSTVDINVTLLNDPPTAQPDTATTDEDTTVVIDVAANDVDTDDNLDPTSVSIATQPGNGSLVNLGDGQLSYTPNPNFNGSDSFTYQISDTQGGLDQATVSLTVNPVNDAPTAVADSFNTQIDTPLTFNVLANDSDIDGDSLVFNSFTTATNGSLVNQGNGNLTYTPNAGFTGVDNFSYTIGDGNGGTDSASVSVSVNNLPQRISDQLEVLYTFDEGSGNIVRDVSGVGTPLDLTIQDLSNVTWGDDSLTVDAATLIASSGPGTKLIDSLTGTNEITIEAWLSTDNLTQGGPARIVSLSSDSRNRNFTLGQDKDAFDVRLRTTDTNSNASRPSVLSPAGSLDADTLSHVIYTREANGSASLYINNELVTTQTISGDFSSWDNSYQLGLANELSGGRPWLGTLELVAVYSQSFDSSEVSQNFLAGPDFAVI